MSVGMLPAMIASMIYFCSQLKVYVGELRKVDVHSRGLLGCMVGPPTDFSCVAHSHGATIGMQWRQTGSTLGCSLAAGT